MRRHFFVLPAALAALSAAPATALADSARVIRDCQDGRIDGKYSQREFSQALRNIPTDVDEYTDCRDVIRRAQLGAAGGSGGASGAGAAGGAGAPPSSAAANAGKTAAQILEAATPAERAAVDQATGRAGAAAVQVGGQTVSPDSSGLSPAGAANVLPIPLIVALGLLGLGLAATGIQTIRSRVLARRTPAP